MSKQGTIAGSVGQGRKSGTSYCLLFFLKNEHCVLFLHFQQEGKLMVEKFSLEDLAWTHVSPAPLWRADAISVLMPDTVAICFWAAGGNSWCVFFFPLNFKGCVILQSV